MPLALEFEAVEFAYPHGSPVLREVDLEVGAGEFLAIAGPNGGGKTTLLRLALGLEHPTRGRVELFGERADRFHDRARLGYLAQRAQLGVQAPATVREVVAAGRSPKALVADPKLLALDEPTAGVDVEAQEALAELLARLHDDLGVTILYVSHEFGAIEHVVERLVLVRERIVFDGPPSSLPGVWHDPSHVHV